MEDSVDHLRAALERFFENVGKASGLSRSALCSKAGVPESTVRAFLTKRSQGMNMSTYLALANASGASINALLGIDDSTGGSTAAAINEIYADVQAVVHVLIEKKRMPPDATTAANLVLALSKELQAIRSDSSEEFLDQHRRIAVASILRQQ